MNISLQTPVSFLHGEALRNWPSRMPNLGNSLWLLALWSYWPSSGVGACLMGMQLLERLKRSDNVASEAPQRSHNVHEFTHA